MEAESSRSCADPNATTVASARSLGLGKATFLADGAHKCTNAPGNVGRDDCDVTAA
jgi:hypothetical protein